MIAYEVASFNAPVQDTRYRHYSPALSVSPIFPIKLSALHTGRYFSGLTKIRYGLRRPCWYREVVPSEEGTNNLPISALLAHWAQYKRLWPNVRPFNPRSNYPLSIRCFYTSGSQIYVICIHCFYFVDTIGFSNQKIDICEIRYKHNPTNYAFKAIKMFVLSI